MTIRSPRRSFAPSSIGRSFRSGSAHSKHARSVSRDLFAWYNDAHHHSGLSYLTPADVHYGRAPAILDLRHRTRLAAYARASGALRQRATTPRNLADRRVDQSAVENDPPGCPRHDRHPGQLAV